MEQRPRLGWSARLVFTRDFHELRRGRLDRGADCTIAYDPARIIPKSEAYRFGDPKMPVVAHVRFRDDGPVTDLTLRSRVGLLDHVPTAPKGEGPMLTATLRVPEDAQWITAWFTYQCADGTIRYDSDYGRNYMLRFPDEVRLLDAEILGSPNVPTATFTCLVEAAADVEAMVVRYHITNQPGLREVERAMRSTGALPPDGRRVWELAGDPVPAGAVLAFDLIYYVAGRRHKDDNEGQYFIVAPARSAERLMQGDG